MDCLLSLQDRANGDKYSVEVSLDDNVQKAVTILIQKNSLRDGTYIVSTKKGKTLNLNDTFRAQGVKAGSALYIERWTVLSNKFVRTYGALGGGVILVLLVILVILLIGKDETATASVPEGTTPAANDTITPDSPTLQPAHEAHEAPSVDVQTLQQAINDLTSPATSYSARKERKQDIIDRYFSSSRTNVLVKSHNMSTNVTTIDAWLSEFIVLENQTIEIRNESLTYKNGKIQSIVIQLVQTIP
jgi:hypothetical protein